MNSHNEIFDEFELAPRLHTRYIPVMLDAVIQRAGLQRRQIDFVAYANGPGAFTGVRIAAATAQGIAIGIGVPLVPVSTLAVLAQQARDLLSAKNVQVALDARMGEAYTAEYHETSTGLVELMGAEKLVSLASLVPVEGALAVGSGFRARIDAGYSHEDDADMHTDVYPTAKALVKLAAKQIKNGRVVTADKTEINYLRNKVAEKKRTAS